MQPAVKKKPADAKAWWYELVVLPAVLVVIGTVILHVTDGVWWGVMLWAMASPLAYLLVDFAFFGQKRLVAGSDAKRPRRLIRPRAEPPPDPHAAKPPPDPHAAKPSPDPHAAKPDWTDAEDVSTGAEILRRGRRYDQRRKA